MLASQYSLASFKRHLRGPFGDFWGIWRNVGCGYLRKSKKEPNTFLTLLVRKLFYQQKKGGKKVFVWWPWGDDFISFPHPKFIPFNKHAAQQDFWPHHPHLVEGAPLGKFSWLFSAFFFVFVRHVQINKISPSCTKIWITGSIWCGSLKTKNQQEIVNSWRIRPSLNSAFGVIWLSRCLQSSPLLYHQLHLQPSLHYEQPSVPTPPKKNTPFSALYHPENFWKPSGTDNVFGHGNQATLVTTIFNPKTSWVEKHVEVSHHRSPKDVQLHKVMPNHDGQGAVLLVPLWVGLKPPALSWGYAWV